MPTLLHGTRAPGSVERDEGLVATIPHRSARSASVAGVDNRGCHRPLGDIWTIPPTVTTVLLPSSQSTTGVTGCFPRSVSCRGERPGGRHMVGLRGRGTAAGIVAGALLLGACGGGGDDEGGSA